MTEEQTRRILKSGIINISALAEKMGISAHILNNKVSEKSRNKLSGYDIEIISKKLDELFGSVKP